VAYSTDELSEQLGVKEPAAVVRDLRRDIIDLLQSESNLVCGLDDVVHSRGAGYRLAECVKVAGTEPEGEPEPITDTAKESDVRNGEDVANHVADDDADRVAKDVANNVANRPQDSAKRQEWIISQLRVGIKLGRPDVVRQFGCSLKTAERDLQALKDRGLVEWVGSPRTGYYRLRKGRPKPGSSQKRPGKRSQAKEPHPRKR
jgi:hypothetical protein